MPQRLAETLGAELVPSPIGPCMLVRRAYPAASRYGRRDVADYATLSDLALRVLSGLPGSGGPARPGRVVFLDLETTGLSGGAATVAFVVGLGWFDRGSFHTWQYVLPGFAAERPVLAAVAALLDAAAVVATFNGKSFDAPILESRWAYHRMPSPMAELPHVDLLHPSRRLWKADHGTLSSLERAVVGLQRHSDVPGAEIPGRYVAYLRGGDAGLLEPILEHNRLDLVSLGALTGLACQLVDAGVASTATPHQALGLGRIFDKVGRRPEATRCYERAATPAGRAYDDAVSAEALQRLARHFRSERRYPEAAEAWRRLLALRRPPARLAREATVALAVHHEHRVRDLVTARQFARRALEMEAHPGRHQANAHRLRRLRRKMERNERCGAGCIGGRMRP